MTKEEKLQIKAQREGQNVVSRFGTKGKVKTYHSYSKVDIEWEDGVITTQNWNVIKSEKGFYRSKEERSKDIALAKAEKFIGKTFKTKSGWTLEIVEYRDVFNVKVKWQDGSEAWVCMGDIRNRSLLPLNKVSVYGKGFFGEGRFVPRNRRAREGQEVVERSVYRTWQKLMQRMYSTNRGDTNNARSYLHVSLCEPWHNFQNFAEWAVEQVGYSNKDAKGRAWCLDKDILLEGNSIYSPETCVFVPNEVNAFFGIKSLGESEYGVNLIRGVTKNSKEGFISRCTNPLTSEREYLGYYDTQEEANQVYANRKNEVARLLADKWEGSLDSRVIDALNNFDVMSRARAVWKSRTLK